MNFLRDCKESSCIILNSKKYYIHRLFFSAVTGLCARVISMPGMHKLKQNIKIFESIVYNVAVYAFIVLFSLKNNTRTKTKISHKRALH